MEKLLVFSKIISLILVPPTVITSLLLIISFSSLKENDISLGITISILGGMIIPLLYFYILRKIKIVNDNEASDKSERLFPYLGAILITLIAFLISLKYFGLNLYTILWLCYFTIYLSLLIINNFWKISSHTSNFAVSIPILFSIGNDLAYFAVIILLYLSFARYLLKAHTPYQIFSGAILGLIISLIYINILL